jgi:hypothetical protein
MLIPYDALEVDTLTRLIEDFVTRDGVRSGNEELRLAAKPHSP